MKIIQPTFNIRTSTGKNLYENEGIELLQFVESMARISHRSEEKQTPTSYDRFLRTVVLQHGDWSVTEHVSFTVIFRVDRGISHELVRHRLFGFTQESTRFVNYEKKGGDIEFIYPIAAPKEKPLFPELGAIPEWGIGVAPDYNYYWMEFMQRSERLYMWLLQEGWRPQEARSVLPNASATTIAVTGNLRNWRHAMLMRTTKETHPDFRRVTIPLLAELKKCIPILYEDIEPEARQIDNLRKGR